MKKVLIGLMCICLLVVGCGKNTDKENKKEETVKASDAKVDILKDDGLDVSSNITTDNKIMFTIKNTSKETIDNVLLNIAYYDNKEKLISTSNSYTRNLEAGKQSIIVVDFPRDYVKYQTQIPSTVHVMANKEIYGAKTATIYTSKVSANVATPKKDDTVANITVKNNSGVVLNDVELVTVFYKGDKVVSAATSYLTQVKESATTAVSIPFTLQGETGKAIDYDKIQTFVNYASKNKAA